MVHAYLGVVIPQAERIKKLEADLSSARAQLDEVTRVCDRQRMKVEEALDLLRTSLVLSRALIAENDKERR